MGRAAPRTPAASSLGGAPCQRADRRFPGLRPEATGARVAHRRHRPGWRQRHEPAHLRALGGMFPERGCGVDERRDRKAAARLMSVCMHSAAMGGPTTSRHSRAASPFRRLPVPCLGPATARRSKHPLAPGKSTIRPTPSEPGTGCVEYGDSGSWWPPRMAVTSS